MTNRQIDVNEMDVRRALASSFTSLERDGHAWRGTVGLGDVVVTATCARRPAATRTCR